MRAGAVMARAANPTWEAALSRYFDRRYVEALELLDDAGSDAEISILRGDVQVAMGRIHDAVSSYAAGVSIDAGNTYAHHRLAACLRQLKRWSRAEEEYRKVLALDAKCDDARIGLGDCLLHLNHPEAALACLDDCRNKSVPVWFGSAVALQMLGRLEEAEGLFVRVLQQMPQSEEVLANLICLNVEKFNLQRIRQYGEQLWKINPDSLYALQALTIVAVERGDYEEASYFYFRWRQNLPEGGIPAQEEAIHYRLSREMVERLIELRMQQDQGDAAQRADLGTR